MIAYAKKLLSFSRYDLNRIISERFRVHLNLLGMLIECSNTTILILIMREFYRLRDFNKNFINLRKNRNYSLSN